MADQASGRGLPALDFRLWDAALRVVADLYSCHSERNEEPLRSGMNYKVTGSLDGERRLGMTSAYYAKERLEPERNWKPKAGSPR